MPEPTLVVRGVVVARDVSLTASPGDVVAVEGPNGSGKSTLLAAAAGLLPTGSASVRPGSVGYAPERAGVLPRMPLHRWLMGLARTSGLPRDESARRTADMLARLGSAWRTRRRSRCTRCHAATRSARWSPRLSSTIRTCWCSTSRPAGLTATGSHG